MIRVSFENKLQNVVASPSKRGYPASNLLDSRVSTKWITNAPFYTTHSLTGEFAEPTLISCCALLGLKATVNATIEIVLLLDGNPVKVITIPGEEIIYGYGEGPYGFFAYGGYSAPGREWIQDNRSVWFEDVLCDSWYIGIDQMDYTPFELGGLYFGYHWESPVGLTTDYSTGFTQTIGEIQRNIGAVQIGTTRIVGRKLDIGLQLLTSQDVVYWHQNYSPNNACLVTIDPRQNNTSAYYGTLYGYLPSEINFTGSEKTRFSTQISIEEIK